MIGRTFIIFLCVAGGACARKPVADAQPLSSSTSSLDAEAPAASSVAANVEPPVVAPAPSAAKPVGAELPGIQFDALVARFPHARVQSVAPATTNSCSETLALVAAVRVADDSRV